MAPIYLIIALVIQGSIAYANEGTETTESTEVLEENVIIDDNEIVKIDDELIKDFNETDTDWVDTFFSPDTLFPSSSATMMAQATSADKSIEEQLESIKEVSGRMTSTIQSDMENLLIYALNTSDKEEVENNLRKRRSVESPMDSTQLIMRLLKHIKSNNEYQNIAIDKMMTAQEIADKFGIDFNPDPEILSDLAVAANEHAKELSSMLNEACDLKSNTSQKISIVPLDDKESIEIPSENNTFYVYAVYYPEDDIYSQSSVPTHECIPQSASHSHYYYNYPYESQVNSPLVNHQHRQPVSQRPSFYDAVSYPPEYYSYSSTEPTDAFVRPVENLEPEPELVAEEYEETMSNRVIVERGEDPGSATVNHVTTYSISEKSHFRNPQIDRLPQQMQYSFYLI